MANAIAHACPRLQGRHSVAKARVARLIETGAFADAALALLELELPQWKLRRLIYDDSEWHCTLSKHVGLPAELDDAAEGEHENLPLAILNAFVEAQRQNLSAGEARKNPVLLVGLTRGYALCCDNFR
jgi:hypothetical protein